MLQYHLPILKPISHLLPNYLHFTKFVDLFISVYIFVYPQICVILFLFENILLNFTNHVCLLIFSLTSFIHYSFKILLCFLFLAFCHVLFMLSSSLAPSNERRHLKQTRKRVSSQNTKE